MADEKIPGITKIAVKGFKSIAEECAIDIRPLTILAGANSSGKSSIMQPLLMLKQTLEAPYDPGPLLIDGPNVKFTEAEQFLSKLNSEIRTDRFQIQIKTRDTSFSHEVTTTFRKGESRIEIVEMTTEAKSENDKLSYFFPKRFTLFPEMSPEEIKSLADQHLIPGYFNAVKCSRCFLHLESQDGHSSANNTFNVESNIFNTIHLPGLRGNPERTYKPTSTGPRYPGTFEHYAANVIHEWQDEKNKCLKAVAAALRVLNLAGQVGTDKIGDARIELQVGRLPQGDFDETDRVSIADVGLGVSQVLPVLVALKVARSGQLVYLEQPELHLHPNAQVVLARVLAYAAKRGVRVVAETHSSLLLLGIQTLVAEGKLSPDLVKLHWFSRNEEGITKVDSVDLDEAGTYGEWSMDFDDVSLNAQSRFLDAVDNVRFSKLETS